MPNKPADLLKGGLFSRGQARKSLKNLGFLPSLLGIDMIC